MKNRIVSIDAIRGFALLGVLLVNAAYFAAPQWSVVNPGYGPLAVTGGSVWSWFGPYVLFEYKSIALFSILFGASMIMVGGDGGDPHRSRLLRRRLSWLLVIALLHGTLIWFGDILLSYAIIGLALLKARRWRPRTQLYVGLGLFGLSMALLGAIAAHIAGMDAAARLAFETSSWTPPASVLLQAIDAYHQGLGPALAANLQSWVEQQLQLLVLLSLRTAGLMLIGMSLLKSTFLTGGSDERTYRAWSLAGLASLAILIWNGFDMAAGGFDMVRVQATGTMITTSLALPLALGYASMLILAVKHEVMAPVTAGLAAVGRMSLSNYLAQSIVMTSIFWSGRGFGLFGELSRPTVMLIALGLFGAQIILSTLWLGRFGRGPAEALWHRLTWVEAMTERSGPSHSLAPIPAIETIGLTRAYGRQVAVDSLDLSVPQGSVYGFLGPNGAGKTTTIRMLLGLTRPTRGKLSIFGHDVVTDRIAAARFTGSLLEARATWDHLSGRENLDISRKLLGLRPLETGRVLDLVGLSQNADRKVGHYSLGMRQRLGLAKALLGSPRLLILDEPMNGLDPDGMADMRQTIDDLASAGFTIFLSSHLLPEVEAVASHIGLMRSGRLVAQGAIGDLLGRASADLIVSTSDNDRAQTVIRALGAKVTFVDKRLTIAGAGSSAESARIADELIRSGLSLFELRPQSLDLSAFWERAHFEEAA